MRHKRRAFAAMIRFSLIIVGIAAMSLCEVTFAVGCALQQRPSPEAVPTHHTSDTPETSPGTPLIDTHTPEPPTQPAHTSGAVPDLSPVVARLI